jgi:hypothetical protein
MCAARAASRPAPRPRPICAVPRRGGRRRRACAARSLRRAAPLLQGGTQQMTYLPGAKSDMRKIYLACAPEAPCPGQ